MGITAARKQNVLQKRSRPPVWLQLLIGLFLVVFLIGGFYSSYLFYATIREIVARTDLPALPVVQLPSLRLPEAQAGGDEIEPLPEMGIVTPEVVPGGLVSEAPAAPPRPAPGPTTPATPGRSQVSLTLLPALPQSRLFVTSAKLLPRKESPSTAMIKSPGRIFALSAGDLARTAMTTTAKQMRWVLGREVYSTQRAFGEA